MGNSEKTKTQTHNVGQYQKTNKNGKRSVYLKKCKFTKKSTYKY